MKSKNERGITLIAVIIIIFTIIVIGGITIVILSKNKPKDNIINDNNSANESINRNENKNEIQNSSQENENSNDPDETVILENQTMYANGNENWKGLMKPKDIDINLYTNDKIPYITIKPIFEEYYTQPEYISESDDNKNIAWTYYSKFESEKEVQNYNRIYTWASINKQSTMSSEKNLKFIAEYNGDDHYKEGTRIHSDIKEKQINGIKIKYVQIQAKNDKYFGSYKEKPTEMYINRYDCIIEFIEPTTNNTAFIKFKIEQQTNNMNNFVDESIIDEVVSRLTLNGIQLIN